MDTLNLVFLFLLLCLLAVAAGIAARRKAAFAAIAAGEDSRPLSPLTRGLLCGAVLLLSLLRLWRFGSVPGGFNQDGAMAAVDALALAQHGTDRFGTWLPAHFTAWGYGQMSVLLSYLMVPLIRLFGLSAVTARLPQLLASFLGMGAAWLFLRQLLSRRAALIGLLCLALCPWHFMQSRWALDCNLLPHMFLCGLALLYRGVRKPAALYASMVFFALCMYSYGLAFVSVPLFLLCAVILLLRKKAVTPLQALLCAGIYFLLSFPIYGTMLINAMGWKTVALPFVTMPYFPHSVRSGDLLFFSAEPLRQLGDNIRALWNVVFLQKKDLLWNDIAGFGTVYRCSMPLVLAGLALTVVRCFRAEGEKKLGWRLLLLFWLCSLATGLCVNAVNVNRINIIFYAHALFIAIAIHALATVDWRAALPLSAIYGVLAVLFVSAYFGPWAEQISNAFFEDFLEAVEYAGSLDCDTLYITPDVQYPGSKNVSEILTMYKLQIDAEYFQGKAETDRPYAARFRYENADSARLSGSVACVQKLSALPAELPPGWTVKSFGSYAVIFPDKEETG